MFVIVDAASFIQECCDGGDMYTEMNMWKSQLNRNLSNCEVARNVFFGASTGFEPVASALALQCSTSWAMKNHTLKAGHSIEFINPWWKEWNTEWNDSTAMVTDSFHLYSRSSHHFILCVSEQLILMALTSASIPTNSLLLFYYFLHCQSF